MEVVLGVLMMDPVPSGFPILLIRPGILNHRTAPSLLGALRQEFRRLQSRPEGNSGVMGRAENYGNQRVFGPQSPVDV